MDYYQVGNVPDEQVFSSFLILLRVSMLIKYGILRTRLIQFAVHGIEIRSVAARPSNMLKT